MITHKAKTLEGKEVEGYYVPDSHYTGGDKIHWLMQPDFDHPIDPSTLRILIKDKEYTPEQVEMLPELIEGIERINKFCIKNEKVIQCKALKYKCEELLNQLP